MSRLRGQNGSAENGIMTSSIIYLCAKCWMLRYTNKIQATKERGKDTNCHTQTKCHDCGDWAVVKIG